MLLSQRDQEHWDFLRSRSISRPLEEGKQIWGKREGRFCQGQQVHSPLSGSSPDPSFSPSPPILSKLPKEAQASPASGPLLQKCPFQPLSRCHPLMPAPTLPLCSLPCFPS